jgi:hypothetical protein
LKNLAMADHHSKFCNFSYPIVFICWGFSAPTSIKHISSSTRKES